MKKKDKKGTVIPAANSWVTQIVAMVFDLIKHVIKDFEMNRNIKKATDVAEQFSTVEHLILKVETKISDNRKAIEDLKNRLLWSNIIIIALLVTVVIQVIAK